MVSGALLLASPATRYSKAYFLRRGARVVAPYIFATALYVTYTFFSTGKPIEVRPYLTALYGGGGFYHLWFFPLIIGLYLIAPLVRPFAIAATRSEMVVILIAFAILGIFQSAGRFLLNWPMGQLGISFISYVPFFIGGYWLSQLKAHEIPVLKSFLMYLFSVALTVALQFLILRLGSADQRKFMGNYTNLNVVLMSFAAFAFLWGRYAREDAAAPATINRLQGVAACTLGIYLLHPLALIWIHRPQILGSLIEHLPVAVRIPSVALLAFVFCAAGVWVLRKIPGGKWMLG